MKKGRKAVDEKVKAEVLKLRKSGKTLADIARRVSLHPQTVYKLCAQAGLNNSELKNHKGVIDTLKATIERLIRELQAADERSTGLAVQLDELQEKFNKETKKTWLDRLIGF